MTYVIRLQKCQRIQYSVPITLCSFPHKIINVHQIIVSAFTELEPNDLALFINTAIPSQVIASPRRDDEQDNLWSCGPDRGTCHDRGKHYPYSGGRERLLRITHRERCEPRDIL